MKVYLAANPSYIGRLFTKEEQFFPLIAQEYIFGVMTEIRRNSHSRDWQFVVDETANEHGFLPSSHNRVLGAIAWDEPTDKHDEAILKRAARAAEMLANAVAYKLICLHSSPLSA